MDTGVGTNNVGVYKFNYAYETGDYQPDGSVVFNGQKSKLWVAFTQVFGPEIQSMYTFFQNNLTYTSIEAAFEQHQGVWSETIFNEDMEAKYIDWITSYDLNGNPLTRDARALPMLLGSKEELRKWWLENRFNYFNSKYALKAGTDFISLGVRKGQLNIPVTVYADSYVTFKVGAQDPAAITTRIKVGETKYIQRDTSNEAGTGDRVESSLSPASRIRSVENLADLELNNADFSRATRLQILRIGSPYKINTRLNAIDLSGNRLLHLFDLRNCQNYSNDLSLSNCLSLENLYLGGTAIQNVILPQGGILKTIQYPTTIRTIKIENQPYLENLIIGDYLPADEITDSEHEVSNANHINDYTNITTLYLDNVGLTTSRVNSIDSVEIVEQMDENGFLYLDGISWEMTASEFYTIFQKINTMYGFTNGQPDTNTLASIGGTLYLTDDNFPEGFSLSDIGTRFGNKLRVVMIDSQGIEHPFYTVAYYGLSNELIETYYVAEGEYAPNPNTALYFTTDYINAYNILKNANWQIGDATRWNFSGWDTDLSIPITSRTEIHAESDLQYRMNFILQTANEDEHTTLFDYFFEGENISDENLNIPDYEKNYYKYRQMYWTLDSNQIADCIENGDNRTVVRGNDLYKNTNIDGIQTWYAIYTRSPQTYYIRLYNTDINGAKTPLLDPNTGEAVVFERAVIAVDGGLSTKITQSNLRNYIPNEINKITMIGAPAQEADLPDAERQYRFLGWKPFVADGMDLQVTGNMDICLTYYHISDYFNNYFLNKLENCNLGPTILRLPEGAFFHNSNLTKLRTSANNIGKFSFANFNTPNTRRIFIFDAANIEFGNYCFWYLQNSIIVFLGTGFVTVNSSSFNNMSNCSILMPNSENPIIVSDTTDQNSAFYGFVNNNNKLYVIKSSVYPQSTSSTFSQRTPYSLTTSSGAISEINENNNTYYQLLEEAGLND